MRERAAENAARAGRTRPHRRDAGAARKPPARPQRLERRRIARRYAGHPTSFGDASLSDADGRGQSAPWQRSGESRGRALFSVRLHNRARRPGHRSPRAPGAKLGAGAMLTPAELVWLLAGVASGDSGGLRAPVRRHAGETVRRRAAYLAAKRPRRRGHPGDLSQDLEERRQVSTPSSPPRSPGWWRSRATGRSTWCGARGARSRSRRSRRRWRRRPSRPIRWRGAR